MSYNPDFYKHELDKRAFEVLDSLPKFVKLCESYKLNYQEIASKIGLMSDCIRLGDNQLPDVYGLLPPICDKLGIAVPELYYQKSDELNACTGGVDKPFIIVTSKLVDELNADQIKSILAHECGHIACKHPLYHSIASNLINGVENSPLSRIPAINKYLTPNLVRTLLFWYRCSELSADRAAVLCDGGADGIIDALLKVNGYDEKINREEFLKQAIDLKELVNESGSIKAIEQMLVQGNTHPRLATRAYECYEWTKTEAFRCIMDGSYKEPERKMVEQEVISAEISISAEDENNRVITINDIDAELNRVNSELERYTCNADTGDYALAVFSGLMAGVIDAVFVGKCTFKEGVIGLDHKQMNEFIMEYAKSRGFENDRLKDAIEDLENAFKVAQDNVWKGAGIGVSAKDHHLADLAHHPTPIGLLSAIVVKFLRIGTFINDKGEWHFLPVDTSLEDIKELAIPAVLTGILSWVVYVTENYVEENDEEIPESIRKLIRIAAATPMLIEIAKCADNWFGHLVSDMGGSKNTAGAGMGIPGIFISLLYEIAGLPGLKDSGLPKIVDDLYEKQKLDLRHELSVYKNLGKQAIPVILNEVFVRTTYFIGYLCEEIKNNGVKNVNWRRVIPFNNRTVDRMMMISSMTFNVADTADAAVHAAIESGGNWVLFAGSFVTRFNYVGAGRATVSIVKEFSNEKKEAELIHQKLLLTEIKTVEVINQMNKYRADLEQRVSEYLAEDLEAFITGFDYMKHGLATGDSDLVIKGNVVIQRVLGREPQFKDQKEFDALMASDEAVIL